MKLQSLCGNGFSLFALRVLAKRCQFVVSWPTTLCENKDGMHFFTLKFECNIRYNKLLLCNSENGDIARCNKNNSEWGFCVFLRKNKIQFLFKKTKKADLKKTDGMFFFKQTGFSQPWLSFNLVCDFPLIARSGRVQVTSLSVWLDVRRTLRV